MKYNAASPPIPGKDTHRTSTKKCESKEKETGKHIPAERIRGPKRKPPEFANHAPEARERKATRPPPWNHEERKYEGVRAFPKWPAEKASSHRSPKTRTSWKGEFARLGESLSM